MMKKQFFQTDRKLIRDFASINTQNIKMSKYCVYEYSMNLHYFLGCVHDKLSRHCTPLYNFEVSVIP
jgi:hypothetical protein